MRYVQVWFHCSTEGCEARAERLVKTVWDGENYCKVLARELPEGWGQRTHRSVKCADRERTFCPEHVLWTYDDVRRPQGTPPTIAGDPIYVDDSVPLFVLARELGVGPSEVVRKVWGTGLTGIAVTSSVDFDTAKLLGQSFGRNVLHVSFRSRPTCARCGGSGTIDRGPPAGDGACPACGGGGR